MINCYTVSTYCKDDMSLIENYEQAANDKTQTWNCHHRLETDLGLSRNELIEQNKYYNVPASELIFLTPSEHTKIHKQGERNPMYGKEPWNKGQHGKCSEETKKKQSELAKKRWEDSKGRKGKEPWNKGKKGKNSPNYGEKSVMYGTHPKWMNNGITRVFPKTQEEIDHYIELGYDFGWKLK